MIRVVSRFARFSPFLALVLSLIRPAPVRSAEYDVFVEAESEEDLLDLLAADEIDQTDFETLVELLNDGVDLNTAGRDDLYALPNLTYAEADAIIRYREENGPIEDPAALVSAGVLSERKLGAVAAFLIVPDAAPARRPVQGRFRYQTAYVAGDEEVPGMWLSTRLSTRQNVTAGMTGVLTRNRVSDVRFDPNRDALSAERPSVSLHVPKFYAQWENPDYHLAAGTYRIGFGQRLTFDNTTRYAPNGIRVDDKVDQSQDLSVECRESGGELDSPCTGEALYEYQSPDYRWTDRLRGAAAGLKRLELNTGWAQVYAFASFQTRDIYQYEIYDKSLCSDPRDDTDFYNEDCGAPGVYVRLDDPLAETTKFKYTTLPNMFNELLGGGNVTYFLNRRSHIGVTGYGAGISWLTEGIDLDFQEYSRLPYGGPFGALGVDGSWGRDAVDLAAEVARTFDSQPSGGGIGVLLRATATWKKQELELTARHYSPDFANPYARPISAPDEYDGLTARGETGLRARYGGTLDDLELRSTADFWRAYNTEAPTASVPFDRAVSAWAPRMRLRARSDYEVEAWFKPGVSFEYYDKDLGESGRGNCFDTEFGVPLEGEPDYCRGEKIQGAGQLKFTPTRKLSVTGRYQHRWVDDPKEDFKDKFRQDSATWLIVMYKPVKDLRLRFRLRYMLYDIDHTDYLEHSVWLYAESAYSYERMFRVKLRYEMYDIFDDRKSTQLRDPNPAHWVKLELEYRF